MGTHHAEWENPSREDDVWIERLSEGNGDEQRDEDDMENPLSEDDVWEERIGDEDSDDENENSMDASSVHTDALSGIAPLPATHYHVATGAMVLHFFVDNYLPTLYLCELRVLMLSDRYVIMPILHFIERRLRARMHIAWQCLFGSVCLVRRRPYSERHEEDRELRRQIHTLPLPRHPSRLQEMEGIMRVALVYADRRRHWELFRSITTRINGIFGE